MVRGPHSPTVTVYNNFITGQIGAGTPAQALVQQSTHVLGVIIRNDAAQNDLYIGNQFNQYLIIGAGETLSLPACDLNLLYIRCDAGGGAYVSWLAGVGRSTGA